MIVVAATCVGRDVELDEIRRRCAATTTTGAEVLVVTGAPGIGRSALLRRLAEEPGALWAQAARWESGVSGSVVRQLLQAEAPVEPVAAAEALAAKVGDGPALVIVDDADCADVLSLQTIATVVRLHRELPVLFVLSACGDLPVAGSVHDELRLEGLRPAAILELAGQRNRVLHPAMVDALTRHTGGNPRDILALLDEMPTDLWARPDSPLPAPRHVRASVSVQLEHCGEQGRALVQALSILGDVATLGEAAELAGLGEPLSALDDAVASGLVLTSPDYLPRLASPLIGAAVIQLMGARAAAESHRRAAELVSDPARRIGHRVAATPTCDPQLADEVDRLARQSGADGAWAKAAALFRDASRLTAEPLLRDDRLTRSVDALVAAGDLAAAAMMVPAVESLRETPLRNAVLGYLAIVRGRAAEAELRLRRAWDIVSLDREPDTAALIAQRHVLHSLIRCRGEDIVMWADRAVEISGEDSSAGIEAAAIRGLGLALDGDAVAAADAYDALLARVRHGAQAQRVTMGRGWLQLSLDDIDGARSSLESAVATACLGGSSRITLWALGWLARVQFLTGDWDRAISSIEQGRALAASSGIVLTTPLLEWTAAHAHAVRGNWAEANAAVARADAATGDYEMMRIVTLLGRAQIAEAEADYGRVIRILEPMRSMSQTMTALQEPTFWPWADVFANALVMEGRLADADDFLVPHERRAREQGRRSSMARLAVARGRLSGATGDLSGARTSFEYSLDLLEGLPLRYDLARVNFAYGQTLRRAGKRRDADAVISTARDHYLALGAQTYVQRCERELKAGGLRAIRGARGHVELTPQERAVTTLVGRGLSNREVAAELFVSPKTVQYHLTRIYAKLGVRSRAELAAAQR